MASGFGRNSHNIVILHITRTFLAELGGKALEAGKQFPLFVPGADAEQSGFERYCISVFASSTPKQLKLLAGKSWSQLKPLAGPLRDLASGL